MKKYKVKKAFFDKETGAPYSVGDTYQTEDEARVKTLREGGYIAGGIVSKSDTGKGKGTDKPDGGGEKPEEMKTPAAGEEKPEEMKTPAAGEEKPEEMKTPAAGEEKPEKTKTPAAGEEKTDGKGGK